ncbi:DNA repair protein rad14 [Spiromyces aspiralis]|uniref:DNA repair protein rad14 n=1 Tax=Spiromyces aspiralis TaxID=68401 RepID=A0ACC1HCV7_9FUNG|nr:DNA repair protein rad14 [Spiromyces aspiralis]
MDDYDLTPEQQRRIEENRKKALERRKRTQDTAAGNSATNGGTENNALSTNPRRPKRGRLSTGYYEYNLATMTDSRGGFFVEPSQDSGSIKRLFGKDGHVAHLVEELPYSLDPTENPKCKECESVDVDAMYLKIYDVKVCQKCREEYPEKYSLLTKTEVKEDYLLTDSELLDRKLLPCWEKPNPHKSTWNNMLLFLREQVESFAIKKWGSLEALDEEFERRQAEKDRKKEKKFKKSLLELYNRTRTETWQKARMERAEKQRVHEHHYENVGDPDRPCLKKCKLCGLEVEIEEL